MHIERPAEVNLLNYRKDIDNLCLAPGDGGCIQVPFVPRAGFDIINPTNNPNSTVTLDTSPLAPPQDGERLEQALSSDISYMPIPYINTTPLAAADDRDAPYNYFPSSENYSALSIYLPIYIGGVRNIRQTSGNRHVDAVFYNDKGVLLGTERLTLASNVECTAAFSSNPNALSVPAGAIPPSPSKYCIGTSPSGFQVLHINLNPETPSNWEYAGLRIEFNITNTLSYCFATGVSTDPNCPDGGQVAFDGINFVLPDPEEPLGPPPTSARLHPERMVAGNDLYYLTKLARLELLGIPQIWYEPLYCNTNRDFLVDGIFDLTPQNRNAFEGVGNYPNFAFIYDQTVNGLALDAIYDPTPTNSDVSNSNQFITFQDKISIPPIFSGHEFQCCLPLGKTALSQNQCCSGHAAGNSDGKGDSGSSQGIGKKHFPPTKRKADLQTSRRCQFAPLFQPLCQQRWTHT